jgi:hypothetical protein
MAKHTLDCWYFSKEKLRNSPSFKDGIDEKNDEKKELTYRQHCANFIQDIGQRLQVLINLLFSMRN